LSLELITAGLDPGEGLEWSEEEALTASLVEYWCHVGRVAWLAAHWPARLGADATREELARDKKTSRKIAWMAFAQVRYWGGPDIKWDTWLASEAAGGSDTFSPEERTQAGTVDWVEWLTDMSTVCPQARQALSAWCARTSRAALARRVDSRLIGLSGELERIKVGAMP
jgi:hypothetical protein